MIWIAIALFVLGALNMAVFCHDQHKLTTARAWVLILLWPIITLAAAFEAATGIELI